MKKVILIPNESNHTIEKPIEFNYRKQGGGWKPLTDRESHRYISTAKNIVYLGFCRQDGDMFSVKTCDEYIMIFKGKLNSGCY